MAVTLSEEDYKRLLIASEGDDMIVRCDRCGAWADRDDPDCSSVHDVQGCWYSVTLEDRFLKTCYRQKRPGYSDIELGEITGDRDARRASAIAEHGTTPLPD